MEQSPAADTTPPIDAHNSYIEVNLNLSMEGLKPLFSEDDVELEMSLDLKSFFSYLAMIGTVCNYMLQHQEVIELSKRTLKVIETAIPFPVPAIRRDAKKLYPRNTGYFSNKENEFWSSLGWFCSQYVETILENLVPFSEWMLMCAYVIYRGDATDFRAFSDGILSRGNTASKEIIVKMLSVTTTHQPSNLPPDLAQHWNNLSTKLFVDSEENWEKEVMSVISEHPRDSELHAAILSDCYKESRRDVAIYILFNHWHPMMGPLLPYLMTSILSSTAELNWVCNNCVKNSARPSLILWAMALYASDPNCESIEHLRWLKLDLSPVLRNLLVSVFIPAIGSDEEFQLMLSFESFAVS